jgi:hypothetical protein
MFSKYLYEKKPKNRKNEFLRKFWSIVVFTRIQSKLVYKIIPKILVRCRIKRYQIQLHFAQKIILRTNLTAQRRFHRKIIFHVCGYRVNRLHYSHIWSQFSRNSMHHLVRISNMILYLSFDCILAKKTTENHQLKPS